MLSLFLDLRGGALYQSEFGTRMRGTGPYAAMLSRRFELACRRLGLNRERRGLDTTLFKRPARAGDQLSLL